MPIPHYKRRADAATRYRRESEFVTVLSRHEDEVLGDSYDVERIDGSVIYGVRAVGDRHFTLSNTAVLQYVAGSHYYPQILAPAGGAVYRPAGLSHADDWGENEDFVLRGGDTLSGDLSDEGQHTRLRFPEGIIEVDGGVYFPDDAGAYRSAGHLRLSDAVTGEKTLSELAQATAHVTIGTSFPGSPATGDRCLRTDIGPGLDFVYNGSVWVPEGKALWLAEETLDRILRGVAIAGNATPTTLALIRKNASDNKGCFDDNAGAEQATRIEKAGGLLDVDIWITCAGTNNVVLKADSASATSADETVDVLLNGVSDGTWDQSVAPTYTIANVPPGVQKISIRGSNLDGWDLTYFYSVQFYRYPYQGVGVAGDVFEILAFLDGEASRGSFITTIGIGRTDDGGADQVYAYGEGIIHRLPMGDGVTDQDPGRADLEWGGWSAMHANNPEVLPIPLFGEVEASWGGRRLAVGCGGIALASTAGTRGFRFANGLRYHLWSPTLASSVKAVMVVPALVRITTKGSGSNFEVGDVALAIMTRATTTAVNSYMLLAGWASDLLGVDLFKLESV